MKNVVYGVYFLFSIFLYYIAAGLIFSGDWWGLLYLFEGWVIQYSALRLISFWRPTLLTGEFGDNYYGV